MYGMRVNMATLDRLLTLGFIDDGINPAFVLSYISFRL